MSHSDNPSSPSVGRTLGLFAKWPAPGGAKTRLAPDDATFGVRVARAFLLDALTRFASVDARRVLACAPPEAEADFAALAGGRFALVAQAAGDLGHRLCSFFTQEFAAGAAAVVVVGTDSPTLPVVFVEQAFAALERADVVLGPAADGGYYLLGCRRLPPVFEGIAWGGSRVLAETVARLSDLAWRLAVLPPWYDVDTPADWAMLCGHVAALRRAGLDPGVPHTEAVLWEDPRAP
jgi:rSAM/selenodomain-associated transferase 1